MRTLWTLLKIIIALAIAIPLGLVVLGVGFGILGALLGLAIVALKLACVALVAYGIFRVAKYFFAPAPKPVNRPVAALPPRDPYYDAAMRELDAEMRRPSDR